MSSVKTNAGKPYFDSLDGLRGVAMIMVLVFHFARMAITNFSFEIGWLGLQIFFVLSGFLITRILLNDKGGSFGMYVKKFYARRSLRIFPLYYIYLALLVVIYLTTSEPEIFPTYLPYLLTYTYNFSILSTNWDFSRLFVHLWSLSVEEQFYFVWPFAVFFLSREWLKRLIILLILLIPAIRVIVALYVTSGIGINDPERVGNVIYWFSLSHFDAFAIGGAINFLGPTLLSLSKKFWLLLTFVVCVIAMALNSVALNYQGHFEISSLGLPLHSIYNMQHLWSYTLLNFLFASLIWYLMSAKWTLFDLKPLRLVGKLSYGMYIFHFLLIVLYERIYNKIIYNDIVTFILYFTVCLMVSYFTYVVVEKKFLKLKSRF